MSLIITSSQQSSLYGRSADARTRDATGIESHASFQNHFTVPVKIPKDAEIAVESVKIRRGPMTDIDGNSQLFRYFGRLQNASNGVTTTRCNSMIIPIRPKKGTYNIEQWGRELQTRFQEGYCNPEIWNSTSVQQDTNASGANVGLSIIQTQRGSASGKDQKGNIIVNDWLNPFFLSTPDNDDGQQGLAYTIATKTLARTTATTAQDAAYPEWDYALEDFKGTAVLGGMPMGLVDGKFIVDFTNCSHGRIGLCRPQREYQVGGFVVAGAGVGGQVHNLYPGVARRVGARIHGANDLYNLVSVGQDLTPQGDFYDYEVEFWKDGALSVSHQTYNPETGDLEKKEVTYYDAGNPVFKVATNWKTLSGTYDRLMFKITGDQVGLYWLPTGKNHTFGVAMVHSSISASAGNCFVPIGETRAALYPRATIAEDTMTWVIDNYESHYQLATEGGQYTVADFRFPQYDYTKHELITGDDYYSNNRITRTGDTVIGQGRTLDKWGRPWGINQTVECDQKEAYSKPWTHPLSQQTFMGVQVGRVGVDFKQAFVIGQVGSRNLATGVGRAGDNDYRLGVYATNTDLGQANVNRQLGFPTHSVLREFNLDGTIPAYVAGAGAAVITFSSTATPLNRANPAFIRLPTLTHTSYNGARNSVSKMLYHLPRFSNEGNDIGDLYFSPGEKTYVKLENTESFLLNNLDIQLVGVDEQIIKDLTGPTIVVLHVRRS